MRSLRSTAVLGLVGVATVVVVTITSGVYWHARSAAHAALIEELCLRGEIVASNVEVEDHQPVLEVPLPMLPEYVRSASGVYFVVWSRTGEELFRSPSLGDEKIGAAPAWRRAAMDLDELDDGPFGTRCARLHLSFVARTEEDYHGWVATGLISDRPSEAFLDAQADERRFHLMLAIDTQDRDESLAGLRQFLLAVGLGAIGLSGLLALGVSGRLVAPLGRMQREATSLGPEAPGRRISADAVVPELELLAHALNDALDRLQASIELQRRLTADVSHELRTPLAFLRGNAELLLQRDRDLDEYRDGLREQLHVAERMTTLAELILTLAREDAGLEPTPSEPVDLGALASRSVNEAQSRAGEQGLSLTAEISSGVVVAGDAQRLAQVINNLVANALTFTPEGGSVTVQVTSNDDQALLTVKDTGPGVPESLRDRLFERFFRADMSRGAAGGFGLGLAIVQGLVEAHGGAVSASFPEGGGSVFQVRLALFQVRRW